MRRASRFDRDFADLHGHMPGRVRPYRPGPDEGLEIVQRMPPRRMSGDELTLRLTMGALGLFWTVVLAGVVLTMLVVGGAFLAALMGV